MAKQTARVRFRKAREALHEAARKLPTYKSLMAAEKAAQKKKREGVRAVKRAEKAAQKKVRAAEKKATAACRAAAREEHCAWRAHIRQQRRLPEWRAYQDALRRQLSRRLTRWPT